MPLYHLPQKKFSTHQVLNQARELVPLPLWSADPAMSEAFELWGREAISSVKSFADQVGSAEVIDWGWRANRTNLV